MSADDAARKRRLARERERRRLHKLHIFERAARERGFELIGGIDEVGRGPLAGPVVAACVVADGPLMLKGLNDSKKVPHERREELAVEIRLRAVAWAIGEASVEEIERYNIYWASILAMERALAALTTKPGYLLTDAVRIKAFTGEQLPVIKGDAKCATVAAASILAKVYRDSLLVDLDRLHPQYGFAEHKGYATPRHIAALGEHGPCAHHRRSFLRVRDALDAVRVRSRMSEPAREFGASGEDAAVDYLRSLGYTIVRRNLRGPGGEIDIVATEGDTVVFVEVKARRSHSFGSAVAAVDARKRRRIRAVAADYLQFFAPGAKARFDVLAIDASGIRIFRGALLLKARPNDPIGKRVANRYDVTSLLGSGGMANVYKAVDRLLQRDVAIKILTEQSEAIRHRFLLEARSLARLNHPGIVSIYDAGESSGIPYIVMELATGSTLGEVAARGMTIGFAVRATIEVLEALHYAHEHDVLHRDVKPSNIIVRPDNSVKIMDFGLSRRISDMKKGTQAGEIAGTISYLPPERFLGKPADERGDLYSLGIILYELFTGVLPFRNDSEDLVAVMYAHVNEAAASPSHYNPKVTPELERIVLKLIEKEPGSRYQSARELQDALRSYLSVRPDADGVRIEPQYRGS